MKKMFLSLGGLLLAINIITCARQITVYKIGDMGPGGGTVFFAEGGTCMELSGLLGEVSWDEAPVLARNYRGGGYSDWYLPTQNELDFIYKNLRSKNIGDLGDSWHWSSSELNDNIAWLQSFGDGTQAVSYKDIALPVRAVRAF
jgi:hypothetical protein